MENLFDYNFAKQVVVYWGIGVILAADAWVIGYWAVRLFKWLRKKFKNYVAKAAAESLMEVNEHE